MTINFTSKVTKKQGCPKESCHLLDKINDCGHRNKKSTTEIITFPVVDRWVLLQAFCMRTFIQKLLCSPDIVNYPGTYICCAILLTAGNLNLRCTDFCFQTGIDSLAYQGTLILQAEMFE